MNRNSDPINQGIPIDDALDAITSSTAKAAGVIIGNLEMIYPKDELLRRARTVILAALGDRGLKGQLIVIFTTHLLQKPIKDQVGRSLS